MNFIITSAFIGNALEFLRLPDAFFVMIEILWSQSFSEAVRRVRFRKTYYWFGDVYAYELFYFIVTVSLSHATPIIAPFGLLFFIIRHCVVTYNLKQTQEFIYTNIGKSFHLAAIAYVIWAPISLQIYNALYLNVTWTSGSSFAASSCAAFIGIFCIAFLLLEKSSRWKFPILIVGERKKQNVSEQTLDEHFVPKCIQRNNKWLKYREKETYKVDATTQTVIP